MTNLPKNLRELVELNAENYVEQAWFKLDYSSFGSTAKEVKKASVDACERLYSHLCQAPEGFNQQYLIKDGNLDGDDEIRYFTDLDKDTYLAQGYSHVIEYAAIAQLKAKHELELELLRKQLEKCKEQRDTVIIARWVGIWRAREVINECNKQLGDLK